MVFQPVETSKLTISHPVDKSQSLRTEGILVHIQKSQHLQHAVGSVYDFRSLLQDFVLNTQRDMYWNELETALRHRICHKFLKLRQ